MNELKFYDIDPSYIEMLQNAEKGKRGLSKIPNIIYENNNKFLCGVVYTINNMKYYVPVSSFTKKQKTNFLIYDIKSKPPKVISSLRFSFMFPVPDNIITEKDFSKENYKQQSLLNKEYSYCKKYSEEIIRKARSVYRKVVYDKDDFTTKNCGDFLLYEYLYRQYIESNLENIEDKTLILV